MKERDQKSFQTEEQDSFQHFRKMAMKMYRKKYWFLGSLVLALLIAFFVTKTADRVYRISASVLIKDSDKVGNSVTDILYGETMLKGGSPLENEMHLIRRFELVRSTLRDLNFAAYIPHNNSPISVEVDSASYAIPHGTALLCTIEDSQSYSLSTENEELNPFLKNKRFSFGEEINLEGLIFKVSLLPQQYREYLREIDPEALEEEKIPILINDLDKLADSYIASLEVEPVNEKSTILQLSLESPWPEREVRFLNQLTENYLTNELKEKVSTATQTMNFIDSQLAYISDTLSNIEDVRQDFKETNTIDISKEGNQLYQDIQGLEKQQATHEMQIEYLDYLKEYVNNEGNDFEYLTVPSSLGIDDPVLNSLIEQLVNEQIKLKQIKSSSRVENPRARLIREKIDNIRSNIVETVNNLLKGNRIATRELQRNINRYTTELKSLPSAERELINIERKYNLSESLYLFLMEKKTESGILKASTEADFKIVNRARIQRGGRPIEPKPLINYASAAVLGLLLPFMFFYVSDKLNNKLEDPEELEALTDIPLLGMVGHNNEDKILAHQKNAAITESFRNIRANLKYMRRGNDMPHVYMISSFVSGEGKTFCAKNLSYIFSLAHKKTVYVNTDLRKNNNYDEFGIQRNLSLYQMQGGKSNVDEKYSKDKTVGITEYLIGQIPLEGIVHPTRFENLFVVPSGKIPPNPSELLMTRQFKELLDFLKRNFDCIILDTPPRGLLADALELIHFADIEIFVLRQSYTVKQNVSALQKMYEKERDDKPMGIIFNDVNFKKIRYSAGKHPLAYNYLTDYDPYKQAH
jgi:capsular exopolysaccharide synthesis family protein